MDVKKTIDTLSTLWASIQSWLAGLLTASLFLERRKRKEAERELKDEREEDAILNDPDAVERMRNRWKREK